jgi:hypothetical protein
MHGCQQGYEEGNPPSNPSNSGGVSASGPGHVPQGPYNNSAPSLTYSQAYSAGEAFGHVMTPPPSFVYNPNGEANTCSHAPAQYVNAGLAGSWQAGCIAGYGTAVYGS